MRTFHTHPHCEFLNPSTFGGTAKIIVCREKDLPSFFHQCSCVRLMHKEDLGRAIVQLEVCLPHPSVLLSLLSKDVVYAPLSRVMHADPPTCGVSVQSFVLQCAQGPTTFCKCLISPCFKEVMATTKRLPYDLTCLVLEFL